MHHVDYRLCLLIILYCRLFYTIWLIGKLPQVFYGLPGSAVHAYVEEYR